MLYLRSGFSALHWLCSCSLIYCSGAVAYHFSVHRSQCHVVLAVLLLSHEPLRVACLASSVSALYHSRSCSLTNSSLSCLFLIYSLFVNYQLVNLRFVYTLNTKTSYSRLTKPKTLKLNAKTGGTAPRIP